MAAINKIQTVPKSEYFEKHLSILNPLLPYELTRNEIKFLSMFMSFSGELATDRFSATGRKIVRKAMGLSFPNMSNYLASLTKKEFIFENKDGVLDIQPILFPDSNEQLYNIKLICKE
ncbi:hypothetical protein FACS1894195_1400 [Bacteroidia bacterium]|nr:hypothetical protein FACS1894195_1400 [Bacteroidia bacterium]